MALVALNLVDYGCGPLLVSVLNDVLAGAGGPGQTEGLRWTLILTACIGGASAAFCCWRAYLSMQADLFHPVSVEIPICNMETTHA